MKIINKLSFYMSAIFMTVTMVANVNSVSAQAAGDATATGTITSAPPVIIDVNRLDSVTFRDLEATAMRSGGTIKSYYTHPGTDYVSFASISFPDDNSASQFELDQFQNKPSTARKCKDIIPDDSDGAGCVTQCTYGSGFLSLTLNFAGHVKDLGGTGTKVCL